MKAPSPAPLYATILPVLVEAARSRGYALAIHGTLSRDLDLVAVPWVDDAVPAEDLVQAIARLVAWTRDDGLLVQGPEPKPHGRRAWTIPLCGDAFVDLSVMPVVLGPCPACGARPVYRDGTARPVRCPTPGCHYAEEAYTPDAWSRLMRPT